MLLLSLACTPVRQWLGWKWTARVRRELGLLAAIYAALHLGIYVADQGFMPATLLEDVLKRPFITAGLAAFLLLVPLALTSTPASVRQLGFVRWQRLHRLVYPAALLAALHYWWSVKKDHDGPWLALVVLGLLLVARWLKRPGQLRRTANR